MTDHSIDPEREAFEHFKSLPRDQPIEMLNLLKFKERADYPADHPNAGRGLTGREAYAEYSRGSGPIFARLGGTMVWRGRPELVLIGPADERWDTGFVARYPNSGAFLAMVTDPAYRQHVVHRQAAVLTSRLIRFAPAEGGAAF